MLHSRWINLPPRGFVCSLAVLSWNRHIASVARLPLPEIRSLGWPVGDFRLGRPGTLLYSKSPYQSDAMQHQGPRADRPHGCDEGGSNACTAAGPKKRTTQRHAACQVEVLARLTRPVPVEVRLALGTRSSRGHLFSLYLRPSRLDQRLFSCQCPKLAIASMRPKWRPGFCLPHHVSLPDLAAALLPEPFAHCLPRRPRLFPPQASGVESDCPVM